MKKINFLARHSIGRRLSMSLLIGMSIYIIISSIILSVFTGRVIKDYVIGYVQSTQQEINSSVEEIIEQIVISSVRLTTNTEIYDTLLNHEISSQSKEEKIGDIIKGLQINTNQIAYIALIGENGEQYFYNLIGKEVEYPSSSYADKIRSKKNNVWGEIVKDIEGNAYIPYGTRFYNYFTSQKGGSLVIYIKEDAINDLYRNAFDQMGTLFIIDENNTIMSHNNNDIVGKVLFGFMHENSYDNAPLFAYRIDRIDGEKKIICSLKNTALAERLGLKLQLVSVLGYRELFKIIPEFNKTLVVIVVSVFIIMILVICILSKKISYRINRLSKKMTEFGKGSTGITQYENTDDEIGILEQSFDKMVEEIRLLIEKNNYEKERQREMELMALQAQINPHFLYNTLDTISWIAKIKQQEDIEFIVIQLAKFFRLSLNSGKKYISIEQEIMIVQSFVNIEQMRVPGKFLVTYDVVEELNDIQIIKLILQPMVENAIKHGLNRKIQGHIHVAVKQEGRLITFKVTDNGVGFDVNKKKEDTPKTLLKASGYGIKNVEERLKLEYGNEAQVCIQSEIGKGTEVTIIIPFEKGA